tara:strand:+ start:799 stop:1089 length:291 start_codon:yes stop_codon:yes gene_type:complete
MKKVLLMIMMVCSMFLIGCSTHVHTIGTGPQTGQVETARQWYILFGLIPLNSVDVGEMSGGAQNYEIKTQTGVVDILMNGFTSYVTVSSRTVKVTK